MINRVSHTVLTGISNVKLSGNALPRVVPPVNSFVNINILEKLGNGYKILIDGSVFQTKLPFSTGIGEQILAKVLNHKPFTLGLDNLLRGKMLDNQTLAAMLVKMGLSDSAISKSVLKRVLSGNKPIVKSKINRMVQYLEEHQLLLDELQMALLMSICWNHSEEETTQAFGSFNRIFDISFEELTKSIYENVAEINNFASNEIITEKINSFLVFDPSLERSKRNIIAIKDKSKEFLYLAKLITESEIIGRIPFIIDKAVKSLKILLIKYILQKSLFNRYDTHPEFTIIKGNDALHLVNYKYDRININGGELSYNISSLVKRPGVGEFIFNSYTTFDKINGEIATDAQNLTALHNELSILNENLSKDYGIYSGIKIADKGSYTNISQDIPIGIKSINKTA